MACSASSGAPLGADAAIRVVGRTRLIRLAVRVTRADAELVLAELLELAPSGVEEVSVSAAIVEYAVYGPPGELPALADVRAVAGGALVEVSTSEIADDWAERWREFHRPLVLDGRLTVRPPWEPPGTTPIDLIIDPGQAFGTGAHATTRLCLELLLELDARGSMLDLGCGSGVLAIAAARLGWAPVLALDYDPLSVEATTENARVNSVELEVRRHDLRTEPTPWAETVCANLLAPLLTDWAAMLAAAPASELPARVIASGLLEHESGRVATAFGELGFSLADRRVRGDWAALRLNR
jgi:ribosomal protein L11 methyltransferase